MIIFIQVLRPTQSSLQQHCETFRFIALIMWNKLKANAIHCTFRDVGKHTPT